MYLERNVTFDKHYLNRIHPRKHAGEAGSLVPYSRVSFRVCLLGFSAEINLRYASWPKVRGQPNIIPMCDYCSSSQKHEHKFAAVVENLLGKILEPGYRRFSPLQS